MDELKQACRESELKLKATLKDLTLDHVKSKNFNRFFTRFKRTKLFREISEKEKQDSVNIPEAEHSFEDVEEEMINDYSFDPNIVEDVIWDETEDNDYAVGDADVPPLSPDTTENNLEICTNPDREESPGEDTNEPETRIENDCSVDQESLDNVSFNNGTRRELNNSPESVGKKRKLNP